MAYPYRTIGAVTVSTILAVGTGLLWWQRPASVKPDVPRPQYEATFMVALAAERFPAMGRTTNYLQTIPANISIIVGGPTSTLHAAGLSSMQVTEDGYTYQRVFSSNQYYSCVFDAADAIIMSGGNPETGTIVNRRTGTGRNSLTLYRYTNQYWRTDQISTYLGGTTFWMSTNDSLPCVLYPRRYLPLTTGYAANAPAYPVAVCGWIKLQMLEYRTNSPAVVWTNTVGLFPNATFQYPAGVRAAVSQHIGTDYTLNPSRYWILPSNTFFETGIFDGKFVFGWQTRTGGINASAPYNSYESSGPVLPRHPGDNLPNPSIIIDAFGGDMYPAYLHSETNWWTNRVTLSVAHRVAQTNYWDGTVILWTNGVAITNQYPATNSGASVTAPSATAGRRSTTNYPYTFSTNCWPAKAFAFERDGDPYTWSTNAYNDLARPLSIMQWQDIYGVTYERTNGLGYFYHTSWDTGDIDGRYWYNSGYSLSGVNPVYMPPTAYNNTVGPRIYWKSYMITRYWEWDFPSWPPYTHYSTVTTQKYCRVFFDLGCFVVCSNSLPFALTNMYLHFPGGLIAGTSYSTTHANVAGIFDSVTNRTSFFDVEYNQNANGPCFSNCYPNVSDLLSFADWQAALDSWMADSSTLVSQGLSGYWQNGCNHGYSESYWGGGVQEDKSGYMFMELPKLTARVVFSALTNYVHHAPAR